MEIVVAENAGFCFGVKRALEVVARAAKDCAGTVYTLGPLIHNPQEIARMEEQGVRPVDNLDDVKEGPVVLSAHGVDPEVESKASAAGLAVIDATCPFVQRAHEHVRTLAEAGYTVVILGDPGHREVTGLAARVGGGAEIVTSAEEARELPFREKCGLVVQTTQRPGTLRDVAAALTARCRELRIFNTICEATIKRQESARRLAERVDVMIVVGGRNSANTARLSEICAATGTPTHHIETAEELTARWLQGARRVGVTAGASTPRWVIDRVVARLGELAGQAAQS
ncbi:MAG: 4-hydroxy-3-methylbut-2-enyl diphosphate reductase [Armatimonadota bacterium]|nr:MAG: 4-hydroxy-3-methylbut-2-enyl diphosphate reductase [Armatimonadota bacterium]